MLAIKIPLEIFKSGLVVGGRKAKPTEGVVMGEAVLVVGVDFLEGCPDFTLRTIAAEKMDRMKDIDKVMKTNSIHFKLILN